MYLLKEYTIFLVIHKDLGLLLHRGGLYIVYAGYLDLSKNNRDLPTLVMGFELSLESVGQCFYNYHVIFPNKLVLD